MGKLKSRIKGTKGKRWAKGQSSSSNPTIKKHREAAKSNFFQPYLLNSKPNEQGSAQGGLTEEALKQHTVASYSDKFPISKVSRAIDIKFPEC